MMKISSCWISSTYKSLFQPTYKANLSFNTLLHLLQLIAWKLLINLKASFIFSRFCIYSLTHSQMICLFHSSLFCCQRIFTLGFSSSDTFYCFICPLGYFLCDCFRFFAFSNNLFPFICRVFFLFKIKPPLKWHMQKPVLKKERVSFLAPTIWLGTPAGKLIFLICISCSGGSSSRRKVQTSHFAKRFARLNARWLNIKGGGKSSIQDYKKGL